MAIDELPGDCRVWIYQANRILTEQEVNEIKSAGSEFIHNWTAHGSLMKAAIGVYHDLFVIIFADESATVASGCSIDSSVHWVKEMGQKLSVDFFDRMSIAYRPGSGTHPELLTINELEEMYHNGKVNDHTMVFNNLVQTKAEFDLSWEVPLGKSWFHQRIAL